jgi:hypothetical protein
MPTIIESQHDQGQLSRKMSKSFSTGSIFSIANSNGSSRSSARNNENLSEPTSHELNEPQIAKALVKDLSLNNVSAVANKKPPLTTTTSDCALNPSLVALKPKIRSQTFETSLILMHKFLKERNLYALESSELNGEYKHRTVFLARNSNSASSYNPSGGNEFGFNLQTYGLLNSLTKQTEYICFINNVQARSSAKRAGLSNGDILLAVDNIRIAQFKKFDDIVKHVKGKNELCLIIFPESTCKRAQYLERIAQIEKTLAEKNQLVRKMLCDEEAILGKYAHLMPRPETPATPKITDTNDSNSEIGAVYRQQQAIQSSLTSSNSFSSASSSLSTNASSTSNTNVDASVFLSPISNHSIMPIVDDSVCSELLNETKPNSSESNIMSSMISSGLGSESSHSVSSNNTKLKNASTPIDPSHSAYFVSMADSAYLTALENDESLANSSTRSSIREPKDPYIVKLIKPPSSDFDSLAKASSNISSSSSSLTTSSVSNSTQNVLASGSMNSTGSCGAVKSKSMAKKCLEKTNRLIRSASTSSMNLINRMNPLGMSSTNLNHLDEVFAAEKDSSNKEMKHSNSVVFCAKNADEEKDLPDSNKENNQPKIIKVCFRL